MLRTTMKIDVDAKRDVLRLDLLSGEPVADTCEVGGLIVRYAADRRIIGIEIRSARARIDAAVEQVTAAPAF
jgi:uncharacterized protein YuzE